MGIKMLIKTTDVDNIANNTSFDPFIDAWNLDSPSSIFLWIFSSITIESSITNPVHKTSANSVIKFKEKPKKFRKIKVDTIEIGTVTTGIKVLFIFLRNTKIIIVTKNIAKQRVNITSWSASDTKREVS